LDDLQIESLNPEDKSFLEEFTNLELLAMNKTGLKSTKNLPDAANLIRVCPLPSSSHEVLTVCVYS
jgi:hypothetical protein